eukprot:GGOE01012939.1.p1 GENE.GGOE01012939.1~~GGOE01012939.1.p1  ORF type:complete len:1397 (-),score=415.61 GGOE01012939.1:676-4659(-)
MAGCEEDPMEQPWSPFTIPHSAAELCIEEDHDPTSKLLADGLEPLLKTIVSAIGSGHPGIFISLRDVHFHTRTFQGSSMIATMGNQVAHWLTFWRRFQTVERDVLKNVTGSFRTGRTTLLLGPPQSGKSLLMKAIAGRLEEGRHGRLQGSILYAGRDLRHETNSPDRIFVQKLVGYIAQTGSHLPPLTVRETVQFAHNCASRCEEEYLLKEGIPRERIDQLLYIDSLWADVVMEMHGIRRIANSPVAAISTGQQKRLTSAEVIVMRTPVLLADEISTGLDSATAFDLCQAMCTATRTRNRTSVVSLVHLTQEMYELFDEVTVLCAGQIAFQGPINEAVPYFESLGFRCPPTKSHAEFLTEVTLPDGMERLRDHTTVSAATISCVEDFGPVWLRSAQFQRREEEDVVLLEKSKEELEELPRGGWYYHKLTSPHTTSFLQSIWLCVRRHATLMHRAKRMLKIRMIVVCGTAIFMGTLYLQLDPSSYTLRSAVLFYTMLNMMMGYNALPILFAQRQVVAAQTAARFYHPMAQIAAIHIFDIPLCIVETLLFCIFTYWLVGFAAEAQRFVLFIVICVLVRLGMFATFRIVGMLCPTDVMALGLATFMVVVVAQFHGYLVQEVNIVPWWIWSYWINPVQYAMTALMLLEFHAPRYDQLRNATNPSEGTIGDFYLRSRGMTTNDLRFGTAFCYLVGWWFLMIAIQGILSMYVRWPARFPPRPPPQPAPFDPPQAPPIQFPPCTLAWADVNFDAPGPRKRLRRVLGRRVLHDLNGYAAPATITALMGSSGSGKTTFLNVLARRKTVGTVHGTILLNGQQLPPAIFHRFTATVDHAALLSPVATVGEALRYSAVLRLPRELSAADKEAHVLQVMAMLDLERLVNCPIGSCLTADQTKRLNIGMAVVANPAVLFLDEPTSGLDPLAAQRVLNALQAVRQSGRTVICTLHQPTSESFALLDRLMVLQAGRMIFFGEPQQVSLYFGAIPGVLPYDERKNAATWMMKVIKSAGYNLAELYASSTLAEATLSAVSSMSQSQGEPLTVKHHYQAPLWVQFQVLLVKWLRLQWRSSEYNMARLISIVLIALAQGSMFYQQAITTVPSLMAILGAQFVLFIFVGFFFCVASQSLLLRERAIFYRERANRMYSVAIFNLAATLAEIPFVLLHCIMGGVILYWMMGLPANAGVFFFWFLVLFLCLLFCTLYGYLTAWIMPAPDLSVVIIVVSVVIFEMVTGLSLPRLAIGWWWRWLHYIVPLPYVFQASISAELYCEPTLTKPCPMMNVGTLGEVKMQSVWDYAENRFNLDYGDRWMYVGIIIATITIIHLVSLLALQFVNHEKR